MYLPALQGGFVWDDSLFLTDNPLLGHLDGLRRIWLEPGATTQYYPLVFTAFWLEHELWGLAPTGYHAVNVLLHAANALLVFALLRRLSVPGAWIAALVFALHPVHVESVAWIAERKNVLSGCLYLAAALSYLGFRGLADRPPAAATPAGRRARYGLALLLFVLALLSKTVTASLPAAILLAIYWKEGRVRPGDVVPLLPFFLLGAAAGLNTAWMERVHVGATGPEWHLDLLERALIASRALCFYVAKLLWPTSLTFNYPRWEIDAGQAWQYAFGVALTALLVGLWVGRSRLGRGPVVAALFFAGTLFPALGFVDLYPMRFSFVADHFQYLGSLGVIVPFAVGATRVGTEARRRGGARGFLLWRAAVGVVLLALGTQTLLQAGIYRDEETVWRDTLEKNPESWLAHNNLGRLLGLRLEHARAAEHFRAAVALREDYYVARTNLAEALIRLGEYDEAATQLTRALAVEPDHADAHYFAFVAYRELGQLGRAVRHLRRERALRPSYAAHYQAARWLAEMGRPRDALRELDRAEALEARAQAAVLRGKVLLALDETEAAVDALRAAVARRPDWGWAHRSLARALEGLGEVEEAEAHYVQAVRLGPNPEPARRDLERLRTRRHGEGPPAPE